MQSTQQEFSHVSTWTWETGDTMAIVSTRATPFCDLRPRSGRYSTARCTFLSAHPQFPQGQISHLLNISRTLSLCQYMNAGADGLKPVERAAVATTAASWALQSVESVPTTVNLPGGSLTIGGTFNDDHGVLPALHSKGRQPIFASAHH